MKLRKPLLFAMAMLLAMANSFARRTPENARITDPAKIRFDISLENYTGNLKTEVKKKVLKEMLANYQRSMLPPVFSSDKSMIANWSNLKRYQLSRVAVFYHEGTQISVLQVKGSENAGFGYDFIKSGNFYLVIESSGIETDRRYEASKDGQRTLFRSNYYENFPIARITDRFEIYESEYLNESYAEVKTDFEGGIPKPLWEDILLYSQETNWPIGINSYDARSNHYLNLYCYNLWQVGYIDDGYLIKYILVAPISANQHLSEEFTGGRDLYFVVSDYGVAFDRQYDPNEDGEPLPYEEVSNYYDDYGDVSEEELPVVENQEVRISERGPIVAGADLSIYRDRLIELVGETEADDMIKYVLEENWPIAIHTFEDRNNNEPNILRYRGLYVAYIGGYKVIKIPLSLNGHMPKEFLLDRDFYIAFSTGGIDFDRVYDPSIDGNPDPYVPGEGADSSHIDEIIEEKPIDEAKPVEYLNPNELQVKGVGAQLKIALDNVGKGFADIKGVKRNASLSAEWDSKIDLPASQDVYITEFIGVGTFVGIYGDYKSMQDAMILVNKLVADIKSTSFGFQLLENTDSYTGENYESYTVSFAPQNPPAEVKSVLEKTRIEVEAYKGLSIGSYSQAYHVVVRIKRV